MRDLAGRGRTGRTAMMSTIQAPDRDRPAIARPWPRWPNRLMRRSATTPKITLSRTPPSKPQTNDAMAQPLVLALVGGGGHEGFGGQPG
jgi:hypothetical protein